MKFHRFVFGKRNRTNDFGNGKDERVACIEAETITPNEIADHRKSLGMSQIQFAKHLGVSLRALQSWEQNTRKPGDEIIKKIRSNLEQHA